jgi:hypothetical protein
LAAAIVAADESATVSVFAVPPSTLNVPAVVIAHPAEVRYGVSALGIDEASLTVVCVGAFGGEDAIEDLIALVRGVVMADPQISSSVLSAAPGTQRNWRAVKIGGADFLAADLLLDITM